MRVIYGGPTGQHFMQLGVVLEPGENHRIPADVVATLQGLPSLAGLIEVLDDVEDPAPAAAPEGEPEGALAARAEGAAPAATGPGGDVEEEG